MCNDIHDVENEILRKKNALHSALLKSKETRWDYHQDFLAKTHNIHNLKITVHIKLINVDQWIENRILADDSVCSSIVTVMGCKLYNLWDNVSYSLTCLFDEC